MQIVKASVFNTGLTVRNTKDYGKKTKRKAKANSLIQTMTPTKVNGKMTKQMAMVYSFITKLTLAIKDIGKMI